MPRPPAGNSPRILIVKLTALGDVIHALPVASALRAGLGGAFIAWLAEGRTGEVLRGHPAIDETIVAPRRWLKSLRAVWTLRRALRARSFDVAIDLQGLTKSALAAWLSGARRRIGFAGPMGRELSRLLNNERVPPKSAHVVDRYLELLRPLGIESPAVRFDLPRHAAECAAIERFLTTSGVVGRFAVINPGAGWPSKRWPPERFAAVARHLGQRHAIPSVVVWAGADEKSWAEAIVAGGAGNALLAPGTSILELAELARRATLFLASDTGPLHLAAAVGTPCVGLFGPMPAARNGPYGPRHVTVQRVRLAGRSHRNRRFDMGPIRAIAVEEVCAACDELLRRREVTGQLPKDAA